MEALFLNRKEAGELLAGKLTRYKKYHPLILGLPRGGIPIAYEAAATLESGLIPLVVRKIGVPGNPELAIGAIGEAGELYLDQRMITTLEISSAEIQQVISKEQAEVQRRLDYYRDKQELPPMKNRVVIVIDDGLATGLTGLVALNIVRKYQPKKLVFAVPVCAQEAIHHLADLADEIICLEMVSDLGSVGNYYYDFSQVSDDEVLGYIKSANTSEVRVETA